ncbi:hypothetical protein ACFPRL_27870 [Pseudoclavibacter helvolus]
MRSTLSRSGPAIAGEFGRKSHAGSRIQNPPIGQSRALSLRPSFQ